MKIIICCNRRGLAALTGDLAPLVLVVSQPTAGMMCERLRQDEALISVDSRLEIEL